MITFSSTLVVLVHSLVLNYIIIIVSHQLVEKSRVSCNKEYIYGHQYKSVKQIRLNTHRKTSFDNNYYFCINWPVNLL